MSTQDVQPVLPPLPEPCGNLRSDPYDGHCFYPTGEDWPFGDLFTADQVHAYARAALTAQQAAEPVGVVCGKDMDYHRSQLTVSLTRFVKPGTKLYTHAPATPKDEPVVTRLDQIDLGTLKIELTDKVKATAFLQRAGILNADGELSERFGGNATTPPPVQPQGEPPALLVAVDRVLREALDNVSVHPCDEHNDSVRAAGLTDPLVSLYAARAALASRAVQPMSREIGSVSRLLPLILECARHKQHETTLELAEQLAKECGITQPQQEDQ